jgi:predicted nucleic acid-binding protein
LRILFDTNVVLDVLLDREPFSTTAAQLFSKVEAGELSGYICATTITTLHYLARKTVGTQRAQEEIRKLLTLFEVAPVNRSVLEGALEAQFTDFEDAVIHEAALQAEAQGIVTRNIADFKGASIPLYSPEELSKMLRARDEASR